MYELADERLAEAGFSWYEISNWARPSHASRHNLGYWQGRAWEAVGPGAHAFDGERRRWNAGRLDAYIAALVPADGSGAVLPAGGAEPASTGPGEAAMLALRTSAGLPLEALDRPSLAAALAWGIETHLLAPSGPRLRLTRRGRLLSNELFTRLV
jgi:oxygen-independent coproporphyrinogen-3 oxidase